MRTTLNLDPGLMRAAKEVAARSGQTLTAVIEDALRAALADRESNRDPTPVSLITSPGRPLPGVDLDDSAALLDLMEGDAAL